MSGPSLTLSRAEGEDLDRVERLLAAGDLPTGDLRASPGGFFLAAIDGEVVGAGGLEVHGTDGLLRSVVVAGPRRGEGWGSAICDELEARARERGVETVYLLTTTASGFFADRGYEPVAREAVPPSVRNTAEFAELCPDSATVMRAPLR